MRMGTGEIVVVLLVVLLVFGGSKIPQLGDALGKGIRNFKRASAADGALEVARTEEVAAPAQLEAAALAPAPRAVVARWVDKS